MKFLIILFQGLVAVGVSALTGCAIFASTICWKTTLPLWGALPSLLPLWFGCCLLLGVRARSGKIRGTTSATLVFVECRAGSVG